MANENITEERHFVRLFEETLERNRDGLSDEDISDAVLKIICWFKRNITCPIEMYQTPRMLWAFFYRYSPISADLTRFQMLEAIRNSEEFRTFFKRPSLEVLSIGSSDLIGLCSVLYDNADFQKLNLTLVDHNKHWRSLFQAMIQVIRHDEYGNKGLLSALSSDSARDFAVKVIISSMPVGSLLVVIDSPTYHNYGNFQDDLKLLYSAEEKRFHFSEEPIKLYGRGLCKSSNQIINVLTKIGRGNSN
ncbi:uncharacterized protein TNIN_186661 [Trichonephila inaurata madagascariensis]|uniref:Uncharacterized protein n=1 Tax=Trichonephila inaurata madagascariensis TaxID=2747483 RepID=A0A8X6JVB6_9ARAC|nr:uncharacterized protein TNIN_186661 [Trichonephila inaurata madagascariensis]